MIKHLLFSTICTLTIFDSDEKITEREINLKYVTQTTYNFSSDVNYPFINEFIAYLKQHNKVVKTEDIYNEIMATAHLLKDFKQQLNFRNQEYEGICEEFILRGNECSFYEEYLMKTNNNDPLKNPMIPAICDFSGNGNEIFLGYYKDSDERITEDDQTSPFIQTKNLIDKSNEMLSYLEFLSKTSDILKKDTSTYQFENDMYESIARVKALVVFTLLKLPEDQRPTVSNTELLDYLDVYINEPTSNSIVADIKYWKSNIEENYTNYNTPSDTDFYID